MVTLGELLPGTVVVALALFVAREVMGASRNADSRAKRRRAVTLLLSEEIERNHWAHHSMFRALDDGAKVVATGESVCGLYLDHHSHEHFEIRDHHGALELRTSLPDFTSARYERLVDQVAELDEDLFTSLQAMYDDIRELRHFRRLFVSYLSGAEREIPTRQMTEGFLFDQFVERRERYLESLAAAYRALGNKKLETWRIH